MSSLALIMGGAQGLITSSSSNENTVARKRDIDVDLAPGQLWRKIQIEEKHLTMHEVLGRGSYSTVYRCSFQNKPAALKMFRNATEEKAFKEIEITFSMRHPNIIGIYAWLRKKGEMMIQVGMVIELANGGDLMEFYEGKTKGQTYSFHLALRVVLGAAKGLAHMHSMPTPVVHRDVKSGNIMIMNDDKEGQTGKVADCGESRRIDLNSTMTQTGSPLWAAVSCTGFGGCSFHSRAHKYSRTHNVAIQSSTARASRWQTLRRGCRYVLFWSRPLRDCCG